MKFTKHFYIEGQRFVSLPAETLVKVGKLGDMGKNQDLLNPKDTTRAGNNGNHPIDWDNKNESLKNQLIENFEELGLTGAVFAAGKSGKVPYGQRRSPREHHKKYFICEQIKKYYRNSWKEKYNVLNNNCANAVEDIIEEGTGVSLETKSINPNARFEEIENNKVSI